MHIPNTVTVEVSVFLSQQAKPDDIYGWQAMFFGVEDMAAINFSAALRS